MQLVISNAIYKAFTNCCLKIFLEGKNLRGRTHLQPTQASTPYKFPQNYPFLFYLLGHLIAACSYKWVCSRLRRCIKFRLGSD